MKKVLMTITDFNKEELEELNNIEGLDVTFKDKHEVTEDDMLAHEAVIGNIKKDMLEANPNLKWFQAESAGVNTYLPHLPENTVMTCATGSYGIAISEYMVAMMLNIMKRIPTYLDNQRVHVWQNEGRVTSPIDKRVLVVGTGNIGTEFAKRAKALGSYIVGIRRREGMLEGYDEMHTIDELKEEVAKADVIALSLPASEYTYHLFNKEILEACKEGSILMNVGRGNVIDTKELVNVRNNFKGIWLDVTEEEPLPKEDPLWDIDNLLITPHITGGYQLDITVQKLFNIVKTNMEAYAKDEPFISEVDKKWGYVK